MPRIFSENVKSDLAVGEMIWFGNQALDIGTENIHSTTLPGEGRKRCMAVPIMCWTGRPALPCSTRVFNPYKAALSLSDLDIKAA